MWIISKQQKFSLRVLLSICLIFCQFQPGVANKSVAYKRKRVFTILCCKRSMKEHFLAKVLCVIWETQSSHKKQSVKNVLLEIWQNSQENTCARVSFLIKLQKRDSGRGVFCKFCEIFKNTFFHRTPLVAASGNIWYENNCDFNSYRFNLVTNWLLPLFCSLEGKRKIIFLGNRWSCNERYFCFLFRASRAVLERHSEFSRLLLRNILISLYAVSWGIWTITPEENWLPVRVRIRVRVGFRAGGIFLGGSCPKTVSW